VTKVVYNNCFGGFGLSEKAKKRFLELKGLDYPYIRFYEGDIERTDPVLVQVVEEMMDPVTKKSEASGPFGDVRIRDVPEGSEYRIEEYDGSERVVLKDEYEWSKG